MFKIYNEDCLMQLDKLEENSIDSIVTDPPYELNFMSKGWDNAGVSFNKETWQKCLRVLKPGGYLLAFGGSRTYHRIAVAIEDAGFEIRDTIMWLYGSGFPKSMDISKQLDKHKRREYVKMAMELGIQPKSSASWRDWTIGEHSPSDKYWEEFKKTIPKEEWENIERKVIGTKKSGGASAWINGMNNKENKEQKYTGFSEWNITEPATDLAKQWQGWGTALKPSFEPIIVARKPFKGSLVDNVIEYGIGGINIDECRVGTETNRRMCGNTEKGGETSFVLGAREETYTNQGRFPANTILTYDDTDFEEVCGGFPNTKSQKTKNDNRQNKGNSMFIDGVHNELNSYNDSGSASRYFYCAKASKKDRDEGLDEFEEKIECDRNEGSALPKKNTHPTVKPTELMQYLIRLVTPNGGTVLDPFMGSGSTGKAVMYENKERNKNYNFIGIEKDKEYCEIAKARISYTEKQIIKKQEENDIDQISLF